MGRKRDEGREMRKKAIEYSGCPETDAGWTVFLLEKS